MATKRTAHERLITGSAGEQTQGCRSRSKQTGRWYKQRETKPDPDLVRDAGCCESVLPVLPSYGSMAEEGKRLVGIMHESVDGQKGWPTHRAAGTQNDGGSSWKGIENRNQHQNCHPCRTTTFDGDLPSAKQRVPAPYSAGHCIPPVEGPRGCRPPSEPRGSPGTIMRFCRPMLLGKPAVLDA